MDSAQLINDYLAGPALLRAAIAGMSAEQLLARPVAERWSTHEVVVHIADFEIVGADRIKSIIAEPNPVIPGRDENAMEARLVYTKRDAHEELQMIELIRSHVGRILKTLPATDFERVGQHTEQGPVTLEFIVQRMIRHIRHHVGFVNDKRLALGLPAVLVT